MPTKESHYQADALFRGLRGLLNSLPSDEEKAELLRTLSDTQEFLDELRLLVEAIPTMESSGELSAGLSRLDVLADRARENTGLRRLLGLKTPTLSGSKGVMAPVDAAERARRLEQEFDQMETADVVASLEQSKEPLTVLVELANLLGMRTSGKERKADLKKRIATHIENWRGYRLLRGEDPRPAKRVSLSN